MDSGDPVLALGRDFLEHIPHCLFCLGPCSHRHQAGLPVLCTSHKIKALVACCHFIQPSQVFLCRLTLPYLQHGKLSYELVAISAYGHTAIQQQRGARARSTSWCCGCQAIFQDKPRHSKINRQCVLCKVFLHVFYQVASDTAKYSLFKGYEIVVHTH